MNIYCKHYSNSHILQALEKNVSNTIMKILLKARYNYNVCYFFNKFNKKKDFIKFCTKTHMYFVNFLI